MGTPRIFKWHLPTSKSTADLKSGRSAFDPGRVKTRVRHKWPRNSPCERVAELLSSRGYVTAAHACDELGITDALRARPLQAAGASALSFAIGAAPPLLVVLLGPGSLLSWSVFVTSLFFLAVLEGVAARTGGAKMFTGVVRITFWGALAMAITTGVGMLFNVAG